MGSCAGADGASPFDSFRICVNSFSTSSRALPSSTFTMSRSTIAWRILPDSIMPRTDQPSSKVSAPVAASAIHICVTSQVIVRSAPVP